MYRIMPKSDKTLTTTLVGEWLIADSEKKDVDAEMRLFQCAVRTAFNRLPKRRQAGLLEGMDKGDVEKLVASLFHINSRYAKDAVMQACGIISSQKELVKQQKKEKERALTELRKKLENTSIKRGSECTDARSGLSATALSTENKQESIGVKVEQLQKEIAVLKQHEEEGTIPKVIFGGRENFELRRDGKLSNAEWKNLRNNKLYSRGDKSKEGGNLNTRIEIVEEGNLVSSQWIALPELTYSSRNRRENLIGETACEIVQIALSKGKGLVIESLDFVKKNKGKRFNRIQNNFVYRRLLEAIERRATRCGVAIQEVHPAYTSIIGKYKYATQKGLSFHQAAAFVIARRGLGFHERIPKKIQRLIIFLILELNNLLPAMSSPTPEAGFWEAKGKREVLRLLKKLEDWRNLHSWSFWYTFNQALRKVGVKPWFLGDINLLVSKQIFPVH